MPIKFSMLFLLAALLVTGCPPADEEVEGDEVGECSDGVDNDQDGSADCADPGCAADLACAGDDDDATGDDDDATGDDDDSAGDDDDATGDDDDSAGDDDDATPDPLDVDDDGDGVTENDGDCDDADPANFPGNIEVCDGQDNDCANGADFAGEGLDGDTDGAPYCADCNDADATLGDQALDADCDGALDAVDCDDGDATLGDQALDADCDGDLSATDCDDADPAVNRSRTLHTRAKLRQDRSG